jgi:UDP-N-acetylenolpyruvoylglucosamine reductase
VFSNSVLDRQASLREMHIHAHAAAEHARIVVYCSNEAVSRIEIMQYIPTAL